VPRAPLGAPRRRMEGELRRALQASRRGGGSCGAFCWSLRAEDLPRPEVPADGIPAIAAVLHTDGRDVGSGRRVWRLPTGRLAFAATGADRRLGGDRTRSGGSTVPGSRLLDHLAAYTSQGRPMVFGDQKGRGGPVHADTAVEISDAAHGGAGEGAPFSQEGGAEKDGGQHITDWARAGPVRRLAPRDATLARRVADALGRVGSRRLRRPGPGSGSATLRSHR
jgi:hypothetical protein